MHAVRNIRLCTKDCLCLYVCPTGATDTETGQVDASKCIGCGICANACPSGAISMVLEKYPPQQKKEEKTREQLNKLAASKVKQEHGRGSWPQNDGFGSEAVCRSFGAVQPADGGGPIPRGGIHASSKPEYP